MNNPPFVVAIVPAKDRVDCVAATVSSLLGVPAVSRVLVVDDGSTDGSAGAAMAAGATVLRLTDNVGKGGALAAAIEAEPDADVYLLVDADLGESAAATGSLLGPVLDQSADMAIAVAPDAGRRGGFGLVRRLAGWGVERASGWRPAAPLSGQRAVAGGLLRSLVLAPRFGVETAMSADVRLAGAKVTEVELPIEHRHTGRGLHGFKHRAGQGVDVFRALWPRVTTHRTRSAAIVVLFALVAAVVLWSGAKAEPTSVPPSQGAERVVIFGMPRLSLDDLRTGITPNLDRIVAEGAVAAMSVRTLAGRPDTSEGYATLGAGVRVEAEDVAGFAFDADAELEGGTARSALARRSGRASDGKVVVVGGPGTVALNDGRHLSSRPGALGEALHAAGRRTAAIGNADTGYQLGERASVLRPAAVAVMDFGGSVDAGRVGREILRQDDEAPFGYRADRTKVIAQTAAALREADVVIVDPGDLDRATEFAAVAAPSRAAEARRRALVETDGILGEIRELAGADTLLLVVSVVPPGNEWHLAPVAAVGPGVVRGHLHSPSTRRLGVVTLTDVAPTVLGALGMPPPDGMIGHALRFHPGRADIGRLRELDRDAAFREEIYLPLTMTYIVLQAIVYLLAIVAFGRLGGAGRAGPVLGWIVLGVSAYPLATFVHRAIPDVAALGGLGVVLLIGVTVAIVAIALRARFHPLSPLSWILGATVVLLVADVATGARLQTSSLLGYSLHTAARFTGLGNTAFATLAATTILWACIHVHAAPRRREALLTAACLFALVVLVDGAPSLGSDVGGILTLVPVFGLTLLVLAGRRVSLRAVVVAGGLTALALALATGIDLLRPVESRTHLGRLVDNVGSEGWSALTDTASRKLSVNLNTYRSPWSWTVAIIAIYMLYVLAWGRGWTRLLPGGSALRAGVVGALAAGLVGYAVNDSGVVVTALVFVYLGPFLTMLALQDGRPKPELLVPSSIPVGITSPAPARTG